MKMRDLQGPKLSAREALECQTSIESDEVDLQQLREHLAILCGGLCNDTESAKRISPRFPENAKAPEEDSSVFELKQERTKRHVSVQQEVLVRPMKRTIYWDDIERKIKSKPPSAQGDGRPPRHGTRPGTPPPAKNTGEPVASPIGDESSVDEHPKK